MKLYFHYPTMIPEIRNVFDPENPESTTIYLRANVCSPEFGFSVQEDEIFLVGGNKIEYIIPPTSLIVESILIHINPDSKDYQEDPNTVVIEGCVIDDNGERVNLGRPTKICFDEWYDELHRDPQSDDDEDDESGFEEEVGDDEVVFVEEEEESVTDAL
ncbi:Hypothetical predicted protein [Paramuricea clavata]|uniref:Uncharacterized protein n=1 Tax=Paramuricea clavata TaxID=317549 RepID=A0A6S7GMT8_PARCT|nr:Hypothetical predicted protein [Paramuricea clavata]